MSTLNFITELFCCIDDAMKDVPEHRQANLYPSEIVTLALLFVLKGVGNRAFYRWVQPDLERRFCDEGDHVELTVEQGQKGPQAVSVVKL